ncbi:MAG: preprotein translocase subunit SecA [Planctomycetota bacterium]|nr:preprotein translocase subunit SecA [Planctomycetota bacterium]
MEFLSKVADVIGSLFTSLTAGIEQMLSRVFGSSNERRIKQIGFVREKDGTGSVVPGSVLDRINQLEPEWEKLSESELKESTDKFRRRLADGQTLDDILPDAFAAAREAGKRFLKMRHYDVQLVGGYILHRGQIAEMVTGEGKTLVSTLPAYLNALAHKVHVITVNDYLALRDMEWMGPLHMGLGLTVGAIQSQMQPDERQKHYARDITYGTNNEFGFDYLRDNMKPTRELQVQGPLDYAIIDEIDNILIDEARTPLIISGPAHDDVTKYPKADRIATQLVQGVDFEIKEKEHTCHMTEAGVRHAEELVGVESFYTAGNMEWPHLIDNALKAHHLYKRDINYVVENDQVVIVDEFTGRKMEGRQWSDGLHQAVESKERVKVKEESQTLATITLQNYFKLYKKLGGMTGTAMTEASEFWKIYKLDVLAVPTNKPLIRENFPDRIYKTDKEKWEAVVEEVREVHATHRPILVGTTSIETSELVSNRLNKHGIKHNVLNAKFHEREAEIIAQAGRKDAVTIATNMAGRGTDIILGGNPDHMAWQEFSQTYSSRLEVSKADWDALTAEIAKREGMDTEEKEVQRIGGLHVVGSERHDSRRIDLQLRGRSGRQGDPGSSRFFISLEDKIMRLFGGERLKKVLEWGGLQDGEAIESKMVTNKIEGAQKKVEERHFDQRKHLLDYDEVMDEQRKSVYSYRQRILDGANCRELILEMIDGQISRWTAHFLDPNYMWSSIAEWARSNIRIHIMPDDIDGMSRENLEYHLGSEARRQAEDLIIEQMDEALPENDDENEWNWLALSQWANAHFGLNTNERELKKTGRDDLHRYLFERANEAIGRFKYSELDQFLDDAFPVKGLCSWVNFQFNLTISHDELVGKELDDVIEIVTARVRETYREKEILFPVSVGITKFLESRQATGERSDRSGLLHWANERFHAELDQDDLKSKSRKEIEDLLVHRSRSFFNAELGTNIEKRLLLASNGNGHDTDARNSESHADGLRQLATWANQEFKCEFDPFETTDEARLRVLGEYEKVYRPELAHAERQLILEILDTAWKEHLYFMDYLRSSIGLRSLAQKDPKVEYKREGQSAFATMWERIGEQVTNAIFRLEMESPEFVGSLWEITGTVHAEAHDDFIAESPEGREPGQDVKTIEPIVNRSLKVGRNDPCICGSGKKYKKCCGS